MIFKIEKHLKTTITNKQIKYKVISRAKSYILWHHLGADDKLINQYLVKNYNTTLKIACLYLLTNLNLCQANNSTIIIKFNSTKTEQLARLITFGNGRVPGSNMLVNAFNNIYI